MSLPNPETVVTEERLNEFYTELLPYLGGRADAGFTPVGTIIAVMGNSAPTNYLACNGQTVNIADYPELAAYFKQQFGSSNYFGGDGTTTFGIVDLSGEFLRGTGTNSHTNQGNGANVGVHQDATEHFIIANHNSTNTIYTTQVTDATWASPKNKDSLLPTKYDIKYVATTSFNDTANGLYTSRPTNTSVLYCIATKNIYLSNPSSMRRIRKSFTPAQLKAAITADGVDLDSQGLTIGDYYEVGDWTYVIADVDTFYGGYDSYATLASHHVALLCVGKAGTITSKWNNTDDTSTGYNGSVLHTYLKSLTHSLGTLSVLSHQKLLTTSTTDWAWQTNQTISALTEVQIFGSVIKSVNNNQQGEGCKKLAVFDKYKWTEIFGNQTIWLRSAQSASAACYASNTGFAGPGTASRALGVVGLILVN